MESRVQISSILDPYLDEDTRRLATEKITRNRTRFEKVLSPIEVWLMKIQSLLVWEKPYKSAVVLVLVNAVFWMISSRSDHLLAVTSWGVLLVYFIYMWKTVVWPHIRVPSPIADQEDWVPIETGLLSVPEMSQYLAEGFVTFRLYMRALRNLRKSRRHAFVILMSLACFTLGMIGHIISGYTICYITMMTLLIWPCVVYHKILPRLYMKLEPHMMTLQYHISAKINATLKRKKVKSARDSKPRQQTAQGDRAETDSDDDIHSLRGAINPELSAAIARTITDSEDESGGSPRLAGTREPSTGYNSDLDLNLDETMDHERFDEQRAVASLAPDVSMMPDFENVCEDSNTFMLEADVMPSMDDVDRSRMTSMHTPHSHDVDTASETDSIPYDDELHGNRPAPRTSTQQQPLSNDPYSFAGKIMSTAATGLATTFAQGLQSTLTNMAARTAPQSAVQDTEFMLDPRDRIADASIDEFSPTADSYDEDSDFEILSKDDLDS